MGQWQRICLPLQETWVGSLVQADPSCLRAISLCTATTDPVWPQLLKPAYLEPCTPQQEKPPQ